MLAAQIFMLVVSVSLAFGAWSGLLTPWSLLIFTFLIGCGTAVNGPAWQASVGDMVPRALLPQRGRAQQHGLQHRAQRRPPRSAASSLQRPVPPRRS
jgi:MFS family permease